MTREEALKQLKFILNDTRDGQIIELTDYSREAIRTVVDILSQEPCEDCVSRKWLLEHIEDISPFFEFSVKGILEDDIKDAPSVQTTRIHAKWIEHPHKTRERGINLEFSTFECGICGNCSENDFDYCPNCGAKMEQGENT